MIHLRDRSYPTRHNPLLAGPALTQLGRGSGEFEFAEMIAIV
jgi:hypothetical protein